MVDEPLAVPDAVAGHVDGCARCRVRRDRVVDDAAAVRHLFGRPQPVPDVDRAWRCVVDRADRADRADAPHTGRPHRADRLPRMVRRRWRVAGLTVSGGTAAVVGSVALVSVAAAATLTTVFAPTHVVAVPTTGVNLHAFAAALGLNGVAGDRTGSSPSGPRPFAFGTIQWAASSTPLRTGSLDAAESASGLDVTLPGTLPSGVVGPPRFVVEQTATVTVSFDTRAGPSLAGSMFTLTAGPAVVARYGGVGTAAGVPTLAVLTMERPTATSDGATVDSLESFLETRPGVPKDLAQSLRLLGDLRTALPIPIPPGASESTTTVAGAPAVVLTEAGGVASGVVWEDHHGVVRTVAGLVDQEDVLGVANQLG